MIHHLRAQIQIPRLEVNRSDGGVAQIRKEIIAATHRDIGNDIIDPLCGRGNSLAFTEMNKIGHTPAMEGGNEKKRRLRIKLTLCHKSECFAGSLDNQLDQEIEDKCFHRSNINQKPLSIHQLKMGQLATPSPYCMQPWL